MKDHLLWPIIYKMNILYITASLFRISLKQQWKFIMEILGLSPYTGTLPTEKLREVAVCCNLPDVVKVAPAYSVLQLLLQTHVVIDSCIMYLVSFSLGVNCNFRSSTSIIWHIRDRLLSSLYYDGVFKSLLFSCKIMTLFLNYEFNFVIWLLFPLILRPHLKISDFFPLNVTLILVIRKAFQGLCLNSNFTFLDMSN